MSKIFGLRPYPNGARPYPKESHKRQTAGKYLFLITRPDPSLTGRYSFLMARLYPSLNSLLLLKC